MKTAAVALTTSALLLTGAFGAGLSPSGVLAQAKPEAAAPPARSEAREVVVHGTVAAVDKAKQTVTLKGPKRTLTLQVRDPQKLEVINVGDPVVAKYYESLAFEVKKAGSAQPGTSAQEAVATSKPGETPAGAVGRQITVTATITAIDKKSRKISLSIKQREFEEEKQAMASYGSSDSGASLGDILGAAISKAAQEKEAQDTGGEAPGEDAVHPELRGGGRRSEPT